LTLSLFAISAVKKNRQEKRLQDSKKIIFLVGWLSIPIIFLFAISKITIPIYNTRYTIIASLAFYLLVAYGIRSIDNRYLRSSIIAAIVILSLTSCTRYYAETNNIPWRDITYDINRNMEKGDLVICNCKGCKKNIFDYYFKDQDIEERFFPGAVGDKPVYLDEKNVRELKGIAKDYSRVWIVLSHSEDRKNLIKGTFKKSFNMPFRKSYQSTSYISHKKQDATLLFLLEKR